MPQRTKIEAGKLRHTVQIMNLSKVQDSTGGPVTADATVFATVRASIETLSGRELYKAQQMVSQVTHLVTIRWYPGIQSRMLVWFSEPVEGVTVTRQFRILYTENPDEKHHVLLLYCIEVDESAYEIAGQ